MKIVVDRAYTSSVTIQTGWSDRVYKDLKGDHATQEVNMAHHPPAILTNKLNTKI